MGEVLRHLTFTQKILKMIIQYFILGRILILNEKLINKSEIILLLNDYKSYKNLSMKQNWNAGASSDLRYNNLKKL